MDFVKTIISADDETRTLKFVLQPDPRRYEAFKDADGRAMYRDKYFDFVIGPEVIEALAEQAVGTPVYFSPPNIESSEQYTEERLAAVAQEIQGGEHVPPTKAPDVHKPLTPPLAARWITFVSVDIVGSTASKLRHGDRYETAFRYFVQEVGTLVGQFHAHILKLTGDGMIAYIDHDSQNTQCDNTVDLCLSMQHLMSRGLNPSLRAAGLPELDIRIGADFGLAKLQTYSVSATGYTTTDVSSDALNRAVKIQESCRPGEVRIGRALYEGMHVNWLERASVAQESGSEFGLESYLVYVVR